MFHLLQEPFIVEFARQPPTTPEISYGSVLLTALYVLAIIFLAGNLTGLIVGGLIVLYRRRRESSTGPDAHAETSHTRLRI